MADLKTLRDRVKSISSTKKITKAMQVVSAAKLKKYKDRLAVPNLYMESIQRMIASVIDNKLSNDLELTTKERCFFNDEPRCKERIAVILTSERGLCGGLNANLVKKLFADTAELQKNGISTKFIIVGKKGFDLIEKKYSNDVIGYFNIGKGNEEIAALEIVHKIMSIVEAGEACGCDLYLNIFKNVILQIPAKKQLLPINLSELEESRGALALSEIEGGSILFNLVNLYLGGALLDGMLNMQASEYGARMSAMDNATKNANELIEKLTLRLNKTRQAIITSELIEIIAAADAV